jgi:UDP-N-acetylmuramate dehydrogenase
LIDLIGAVRGRGMPHFILGGGSNVLAPDEPWDVVAIQPHLACSRISLLDTTAGNGNVVLYVGAGVRVARLLRFCLRHGLGGAEFLVGIPGMVGGALAMNAGTREGCIADVLLEIDILDGEGARRRVGKSELSPAYRSMRLPGDWVVLGGSFELQPRGEQSGRARLLDLMRQRKRNQPLGWPSAGCIFKNPGTASAGMLIDRAGLKGLRLGDAEVSEKHANWIINRGNARARDVIQLIEHIEERVFDSYGVCLEREIKILGSY